MPYSPIKAQAVSVKCFASENSSRRSDKILMLVKYNETCIDSSSFVNTVKVHFLVGHTSRIFVHRCCQQ